MAYAHRITRSHLVMNGLPGQRFPVLGLILIATLHHGLAAEVTPDMITPYKTLGDITLSLHLFNPPNHHVSDLRPAIVFFFGGGWTSGTPSQFYPQSAYLASRGMIAICAEYRIASKHQTTPQECVMDGKSAMRWVRSHAKDLGVDPDRLAAGGGSAGGHVAAATATLTDFDEDADRTISCRPNALVLFNPVFDNGPTGYGHERVKDYWERFSPMHNITATTPPTVVFLGTQDHLIPVATAEEFTQRMHAVGVTCDLHLYPDQKHGFFNTERYRETLLEADRFLTRLGYLTGPPTLAVE